MPPPAPTRPAPPLPPQTPPTRGTHPLLDPATDRLEPAHDAPPDRGSCIRYVVRTRYPAGFAGTTTRTVTVAPGPARHTARSITSAHGILTSGGRSPTRRTEPSPVPQ